MSSSYDDVHGSYDNIKHGANMHKFYDHGVEIGDVLNFSVDTLVYTIKKVDGTIGYFQFKAGKVVELKPAEA